MTTETFTVADLIARFRQTGQPVTGTVRALVAGSEERQMRSGRAYDVVTLGDKTGRLQAKDFRRGVQKAGSPQFVTAVVKVEDYQGRPSPVLDAAEALEGADPADFEQYDADANAAHRAELGAAIESISPSSPYRAIVEAAISPVMEDFCSWPAATRHHHAYKGGLVEHTLEVLRYARHAAAGDSEPYDADLLAAGALLHDIGKLDEYSFSGCRALAGELAYHLAYGQVRLGGAVQRAKDAGHDIPAWAVWRLAHIIEQSHGEYRLDTGREPVGKEPRMIAAADLMSARRLPSDRAQDILAKLAQAQAGS